MYSQYYSTANANKNPAVKVEDFIEHLAMLQANMNEQFQADYDLLASDTTEYTFHAARLAVNVNKNRYKNIIPCKSIYVRTLYVYLSYF